MANVNSIEKLLKSTVRHEEYAIILIFFFDPKLCAFSDVLPGRVFVRESLVPF